MPAPSARTAPTPHPLPQARVLGRLRGWVRRPQRAAPYAVLLALGMLLWGRLLLKEPPRVASADDAPPAPAVSTTTTTTAAAAAPQSEKSSTPAGQRAKSPPDSAESPL